MPWHLPVDSPVLQKIIDGFNEASAHGVQVQLGYRQVVKWGLEVVDDEALQNEMRYSKQSHFSLLLSFGSGGGFVGWGVSVGVGTVQYGAHGSIRAVVVDNGWC